MADYRDYSREDEKGPLALAFERIYAEEVAAVLDDVAWPEAHKRYLRAIAAAETHAGYFSQDKKTKRAVDRTEAEVAKAGGEEYDLILKDKASLLSLADTPRARVRFIFSHSALQEGWDNPNVFVICFFKAIAKAATAKEQKVKDRLRQKVGRGLRLCVTQEGGRWATGDTHAVNRLTVVARDSCKDFVATLQSEFAEAIKSRAWAIKDDFLKGRVVKTPAGLDQTLDAKQSRKVHAWLTLNDYLDGTGALNEAFRRDRADKALAAGFPRELEPVREGILAILDTLAAGREVAIANARARTKLEVNRDNLLKPGFQTLWARLNQRAFCQVAIDTPRLIEACVAALNSAERGPKVPRPSVTVEHVSQKGALSAGDIRTGEAFAGKRTRTDDLRLGGGAVAYDLVGELADAKRTGLTRRTLVAILRRLLPGIRDLYAVNPEAFIREVARIINAEQTRQVLESIAYRPGGDSFGANFFADNAPSVPTAWCEEETRLRHHLYPWLDSDSRVERDFAVDVDGAAEVEAFVKLPAAYRIPLPNGETYNPDWAIAFKHGTTRHVCIVAETKGDSDEGALRGDENLRKTCANAWIKALAPAGDVTYHIVASYDELADLIHSP